MEISYDRNIVYMLDGVRKVETGNQKALMEIPLELRQLIIGKENSNNT